MHDGVQYLGLLNRDAVALLGARAKELPARVQGAYGRWLWGHPTGLGYVNVRCWPPPSAARIGWAIGGWLRTMELLARLGFSRDEMGRAMGWLWDQRGATGLWDFGSGATGLRVSVDWRDRGRRAQDHSLAALAMMSRFLRDGGS